METIRARRKARRAAYLAANPEKVTAPLTNAERRARKAAARAAFYARHGEKIAAERAAYEAERVEKLKARREVDKANAAAARAERKRRQGAMR